MENIIIWNVKCLEPPPVTTYKSHGLKEIDQLRDHCKKAVDFFSGQNALEKEAALVSRCIYRMKMKFRSDKGLKSMEKLNRALVQYKGLKFHGILDDFLSCLLDEEYDKLYVPTRNMLDYILVRLQGIVCLMCRAAEAALIVAECMGNRICIGQFWKIALIMLGIVSRIWSICRNITKESCQFYKNIKPARKVLTNVGTEWLPSNYIFPDNLEGWINIDWVDTKDIFMLKIDKARLPVLEIIDIEECGECIDITNEGELIVLTDNGKQGAIRSKQTSHMFELLIQNEDLGEVINDSSIKGKKNIASMCIHTEDDSDDHEPKLNKFYTNKETVIKDNNKKDLLKIRGTSKLKIKSATIKKKEKVIKGSGNGVKNKIERKCTVKTGKSSLANKIDNITSINELKVFMTTICKRDPNSMGIPMINKLQLAMISKYVRKIIKKVNKKVLSDSECIAESKTILKSNFT